ncbi:hypothetical protein PFUGPA_00708 [Plasmodium falciparum Palo Alto/Uganda]|uniref:Uncharacterized protein n=7 Tax=Plasmodium falciparum TaxID=5833 RepID=A0A5K1K8R2_PLAF7|nr:conserved Plasmodium protein, unknown function [Plasmodium falciparum 3D7]ETW19428.1 hypothetical protein PFFVO_01607 [Plasmodium falciparum Vietnam Oak-Knoll (FVO)]ETW37633.1 hypothetical protein PFTANZ_01684 [Plasmodium falciparum Tanzania (2000708)]ETW57220.1 hypothetical protein PFUGPA_00708 [Plasmodium falciparum Palo Alto/Uganda]ETW62430.1 hypothetical protein PFMC_01619 [Plasmodium falciparum CAMP/Malaysia]EUR74262.1 hypothetical protein PFBG_01620 [Plasmodium falciparum 7G8]EWC8945|eukprot:XP_001348967.1 conserved Plasmodium protein, unknown function [Plasmodium falciparum 3D7]
MLASCFYSFFGKCIHIKPYIISSKIIKNGKLFSTKKVPIILIESVKDIKNMINHIETIYCNNSNNNKEKREKGFFNFEKKKIGIIYLDKNCEKIYNLWNYYDLRNENITKEKNNVNEYKTYHHNDYNRNNKLNHIFKLCSNDDGDMNIMKRNVIGIYVPVERNIFSSKINYFYLFNNLKELTKGKLYYEMYFILPHCIFFFSFVSIYKELIYYKKLITFFKKCYKKNIKKNNKKKKNNKRRNISHICHTNKIINNKNKILINLYCKKEKDLKKEIKLYLEKIFFNTLYTKVIYEDSIELSSFLYNFLEINSKNVIDLQYLYQCVISLYNLKILKHDIFATSLVLYPDLYNNILTYEYKKKRGEYKKNESNNNIINKCKQNYRDVNNNPPINIQDGDNLLNKSTRHNIKDKIMNNNLKQAYPDEYFMCRIKKKCVSIYNNNDMNELSNFERQLLHIMYLFPCASKLLIKYKDVEGYHISFKINDILKRYRLLNCIINKFIMNKNKVNDNVNNKEEKKMEGSVICEGGHKERATINKEFIQDCNNSNGYYNKSFDNFNEASDNFNEASYNFNKSSDHSNKSSDHSNKLSDHSNKLSDHFNKSYDHFNKSSETNKQPHMHCNPTLDNYASYQDKLILSLCKQIHIKEDILYEHSLIIGKHIYAYIYEINKTSQNIVFRFNFNLKDIIFKNVICSKNSYDEEDKEENIKTLNGYLQNIYENMFLDDIIIEQRNEHIYNYKNNILVGLLHDKENNFHYFSDKNVGDIVLCTICNISSCGKYIYIERFDTKNLIYIFRKGKYVNLEKNYNYDDINEINEDVLKEIM